MTRPKPSLQQDLKHKNDNIPKSNRRKKKRELKKTVVKKDYLQIHDEAILVDTHNDFVWKVFDKGASFGQRNSFTQSDLPRFKAGGLDVQVFAVWIPMGRVSKSYSFVISQIDRLKNMQLRILRISSLHISMMTLSELQMKKRSAD